MTTMKTNVLGLIAIVAVGCTTGDTSVTNETPNEDVVYIDSDGDGVFDAIDVDYDGTPDYFFDLDTCEACNGDLDPIAFCSNPFVDSNGDGLIDGIDFNCDGIVDISLLGSGGGDGGGGGGNVSVSQCKTSINGRQISCERSGSGPSECECSINGAVVSTCTTTSTSACSQPGGGNCCGF